MDVNDVPVAVVTVDRDGRAQARNDAARELIGAAGRLLDVTADADREQLVGHLEHVRATGPDQRTHLEITVAGIPALLASSRLDDGTVVCAITEIAAQHQRIRDLEQQAFTDALTGLANRSLFVRMLDQSLRGAERSKAPTAVLFIDIDNFKMVNDANGHPVGDAVLVEMARRLRAALRPTDLVARVGGDEFVVLAADLGAVEADEVARRVLALCSAPLTAGGATLEVSVSVGVTIEDPGSDPLRALAKADTAMYAAKAAGRATTVTWTPRLDDPTAGGAVTEVAALQEANRELRSRYQQLRQQARRDARTGLLRDQAYEDHVHALSAAGVDFSVLFVDVDHFHGYNERYTHIAGHQALATLAAGLREITGQRGTVFRYGGEEFTIVCPRTEVTTEEAEDFARRLPARVEDLDLPYDTGPFGHITVSAGVAHTEGGGDVTADANAAMLAAKAAGRNRTQVHQPGG